MDALKIFFATAILFFCWGVLVGNSGLLVNDKLRSIQIECGLAHYDDKTGEFVEHEK